MERIIVLIILLCSYLSLFSQISFFFNENTHSISKKSNYYEDGLEFWVGVGHREIEVYRIINNTDTILLFSSFGCTQYQYDGKSLTLYVWVDYYFSNDFSSNCLCVDDSDKPCKPDTSVCDIKFRFNYMENYLTCSVSDLKKKYDFDSQKIEEMYSTITSSSYIKLTLFDAFFSKKKYQYSYGITTRYIFNYYDLALYCLRKPDIETLLKFSRNLNNIIKNDKLEGEDEQVLYINYVNNLVKYIWPLRNQTYTNGKIDFFQKQINTFTLMSYPNGGRVP